MRERLRTICLITCILLLPVLFSSCGKTEQSLGAMVYMPFLIGAFLLVSALLFLFFLLQKKSNESRRFENLTKERAIEIDQLRTELIAALENTKAESNSKSVFLANMSHEIRIPMNSIVGFLEMAMDEEIPLKTREYLGKILENTNGLLQIVNDIFDISKLESGVMELEKNPFDIHELFASCRTQILPRAAEKGIMLYFYAEPSIGQRPLGDTARLRQVLVNLLLNAVRFTNAGMIKLHAAILEKSDTSIMLHFEVKDSGVGMTIEQMEKIFDPFEFVQSDTTRKFVGTGLGLTITKNLIELMGGLLSVESTPGIGSKFSFDLSFNTVDIIEEELLEQNAGFSEVEKPSFEGEVLLCEDNAMNQQVICEHLARVGIKTYVAENGKLGVEMVKDRIKKGEKQFDLIFMDMHMPEMDGLEASSEIFELKTGIPIIAMTANIMANDREIYQMSGMNDCVAKPFSSQELWRCLLKYLNPVVQIKTNNNRQEKNLYEDEVRNGKEILHYKENQSENDFNLENDSEFQKKLKMYFVTGNKNIYEEIVKALKDGDIQLAYRLVHTLKGNAGMIKSDAIRKAAADVEIQIKSGTNMLTSPQMAVLENELKAVLAKYAHLFNDQ